MKICLVGAEFYADGWTERHRQTDMTKLTGAFRNFAEAPKMDLKGLGWEDVGWNCLPRVMDK
jgi:hypothetical protein